MQLNHFLLVSCYVTIFVMTRYTFAQNVATNPQTILTSQAANTNGTLTEVKTNVNIPPAAIPKAPVNINTAVQSTGASMQITPMPSSTSHSIVTTRTTTNVTRPAARTSEAPVRSTTNFANMAAKNTRKTPETTGASMQTSLSASSPHSNAMGVAPTSTTRKTTSFATDLHSEGTCFLVLLFVALMAHLL